MAASPNPELSSLRDALAGQYEVECEIGRGGMGVVYRARDVRLDRPVAIKLLPGQFGQQLEVRERFLREARVAARLSHPNIIPVYRADEIAGLAFFVMAYVDGQSLGERVRASGPLPPADAVRWLREVALALGYAHARGIVHRDVKPENILIDGATGRALIGDFGIARLTQASPLTATGQVLGTVHFMSPEQVIGESLDGRSDLYSLGVVGYYALSGELPFVSETAAAVLVAHATRPAPPLGSICPALSPALADVIDRCLRKDPAARYADGEALADALGAASLAPRDAATASATEPRAMISEVEAERLWKRAAQLQAEAAQRADRRDVPVTGPLPATATPREGYRLGDVKAAAIEAGISERYVAIALDELRPRSDLVKPRPPSPLAERPTSALLAGGPTSLSYDAVVAGEVPDSEFEMLVETIRRSMGNVGHVSTLGRSLAWTHDGQQRKMHVTIVPRAGRTTIRIDEKLGPLAGALFGGIMGGVGGGLGAPTIGIAMGAFHSGGVALACGGGIVAGAYLLARTIFSSSSRRRGREHQRLLGELTSLVEDSIREQRNRGMVRSR
ncbi:MAG: serine/threonine protein kinase [Gemmatimonadota bacterium]|nr:serine/threonine protein kinase [Gemmatimonadota bacterium]